MACGVTLKRSLDLDPYYSPENSKRARHQSPLYSSVRFSTPSNVPSATSAFSGSCGSQSSLLGSPFAAGVPSATISHDQLEAYISAEVRRMRRSRIVMPRRTTPLHGGRHGFLDDTPMRSADSPSSVGHGSSSDSDGERSPKLLDQSLVVLPKVKGFDPAQRQVVNLDQPLFSYKQVQLICERLLHEQESKLREEYDRVLNSKLAEQYETFVRFAQDQIHRRMTHTPASYLS